MKSKEKENKKNIVFLAIIILIVILIYAIVFIKSDTNYVQAISNYEIKISSANKINIENIIEQNTFDNIKEEILQEETQLEYITIYKTNKELPKGEIQVVQEGREGKQLITKKIVYENNIVVREEQISTKVTKASINKIVEVGGANYTSNYKVKVGDILYVTSDRLAVMSESNIESVKVTTLSQNDEMKLLEISNEWYRISCKNSTGWVKSECTTYINNNKEYNLQANQISGQQLKGKLSFSMNLNKPSGLSLEQFKKILNDSKDVNKVFFNNAEYFYYIEKQYNINGIFVASVGIHESAWGTSKISLDKKNLFGYGAYDSNPYNGAYSFSSYSESIDLIARVFVKYYLNPKGTSIYGDEKAAGTYYNGSNLNAVNKKYATDKNWANGVYSHMKYLYNKL